MAPEKSYYNCHPCCRDFSGGSCSDRSWWNQCTDQCNFSNAIGSAEEEAKKDRQSALD
jgi:hypothetical protein